MTDAGPRIFRTLEKSDGRDSFDAIVRAAGASFAALKRPSASQIRDFGRLVMPLFDRTDAETRRILAASLATCALLPREFVERLLQEPTAVSAPFLLASPALTAEDLAGLAKRRDAATKKVLKARGAASAPAAPKRRRSDNASRPLKDAPSAVPAGEPKRRPSPLRQTALLSTGVPVDVEHEPPHEQPAVAAKPTVDETRAILRQLATTGRRPPAAPVAAPQKEADLLSLALDRDVAAFHASLAAKLLLEPGEVEAIETDETGRRLATALRALDTGRADALTMLMMLKPAIGSDVAVFEAMEAFYDSLDRLTCRARYPIGPGAFPEAPTHQPVYSETRVAIRPEARSAVFGRRASIPTEGERRNRRS